VNKVGHRPTHLRIPSLKSCLDYTSDLYYQGYHGFSSTVRFPFPIQDMDEEYEGVTERNRVRSQPKVRDNEQSVNKCVRERME
jgi:hypothetical protein